MSIAVVVPTVREECWDAFVKGWDQLFKKHKVVLIKVQDGDEPKITKYLYEFDPVAEYSVAFDFDMDLIFNKNDGVRNLGFAYVAKYLPDVEYIITLDDDTLPHGDTIQDHLDALNRRYPLNWMSSASEYMRGVPYWVREQAECVVSHGVWEGVKDWDAPTQLVMGNREVTFYKGQIPQGVYFPFCGMNVAFKRKMLPVMYYAPMGYKVGMDRFADIWLGINLKRYCDKNNVVIASGYAVVDHNRASNVWKNLQKEAVGLELNERYFDGVEDHEYFKKYNNYRLKWQSLMEKYL